MAGKGPAPKPNRVRRNADIVPLRVIEVESSQKPDLPEFEVQVTIDGELVSQQFVWPEPTRRWWAALDLHPLVTEFIDTDWSYLLDTARLHAAFWAGDLRHGPELRLREAKYGFTPEDRLRLRIQFADTDEAEDRMARRREGTAAVSSSRSRRGPLTSG